MQKRRDKSIYHMSDPSHLGRQRGKRHVWPISCPSSCTIALQANYKPNCQVYMLYRDSLQMWFHYVSILIFRMLTLKQAKGGNHCHMKVWQNAAVNITIDNIPPRFYLWHNTTLFRTRLPYTRRDVDIDLCDFVWHKAVVSKFLVSQARPHQIEQKTQLFFY